MWLRNCESGIMSIDQGQMKPAAAWASIMYRPCTHYSSPGFQECSSGTGQRIYCSAEGNFHFRLYCPAGFDQGRGHHTGTYIRRINAPPGCSINLPCYCHTVVKGCRNDGGGFAAVSTKVLIKVEDLQKSFGTLHALNGVNAEIKTGDVTVVIGPSGVENPHSFGA